MNPSDRSREFSRDDQSTKGNQRIPNEFELGSQKKAWDLTAETTFYFYDNGDLLQALFYADTLDTATGLISLEVDPDYEVDLFCIDSASNEEFCQNAGAGDLIFDEGTSDEFSIIFARTGDDLTLSGNLDGGFDFGTGTEPATFMITLERIVPVDDRGPLVE